MNKAEFKLLVEGLLNKFKEISYDYPSTVRLIDEFVVLVETHKDFINIYVLEQIGWLKQELWKAIRHKDFDKYDRAMNVLLNDIDSLQYENSFPV